MITKIRELLPGKNISAIALMAYAGAIDRQRSFDAGYQKHLAKPINIPELLTTIKQLIQ